MVLRLGRSRRRRPKCVRRNSLLPGDRELLAKHRWLIAGAIFALVVLSRLPFVTSHLWAWDSVLYARALEHGFHVAIDHRASRPHPPGYIWYVGAAQLARAVLGDSNSALVVVSIIAAAAGSALLWIVALRYVRPSIALIAALAFAASPVTWTYSEVAYPYTLLALLSLALGALFLARWHPLLLSFAFGALSGARQDLLVLLAPLWIWSLWPPGRRRTPRAVALLAGGVLTWWIPSAALSGGAVEYTNALLDQGGKVVGTYSVPAHGAVALAHDVGLTAEALWWGLLLCALPLAVMAARAATRLARTRRPRLDSASRGLLLWVAPPLAFYVLVHIGEWGYTLSVLPALFLAAGIAFDRLAGAWSTRRLMLAGAVVTAVPALIFLAGDGAYQATVGDAEFSAAALARHDAALAARVAYVRRSFPVRSTLILARDDGLLVRYYLPEYRTIYWDPDPYHRMEQKRHRAMRATNVIVFTAGLQPQQADAIMRIQVAPGVDLAYLALDPGFVLELDGERYVVRYPPTR